MYKGEDREDRLFSRFVNVCVCERVLCSCVEYVMRTSHMNRRQRTLERDDMSERGRNVCLSSYTHAQLVTNVHWEITDKYNYGHHLIIYSGSLNCVQYYCSLNLFCNSLAHIGLCIVYPCASNSYSSS